MLVIVLNLCMLCLGHHFMSLFKQLNDLMSNGLCRSIARGAKSKINGQSCPNSMYKHERYLTSVHIDCCVDCQLNIWQFGKPSNMFLIQQERTQYLLEYSMFVFGLFITLWRVNSRVKCFYTQEFPKLFLKLRYKRWVSATFIIQGTQKHLTTYIKNKYTVLAAVSILSPI